MRRIIVVLAAMAAMVVVYAGAAWATSVNEVEPNDSIDEAQNIDPYFSLDSDPNIAHSTTAPHATVDGTGNGTFDYYAFSVPQAGFATIGLFDIDGAIVCPEGGGICEGFDSYVQLYDTNGNLLAQGDDAAREDPGSEGSFALDSFLEYNFPSAGTYYIAVGRCCVDPVPDGVTYQLHVSLGDRPFTCQGILPTIEEQQGRTLKGTRGDDVILGTQGADTINGNGGNDTICGSLGNDSISGGDGNDFISGGDGNDRIKGNRGEDILYGEGGDDTLDGGLGPDDINGGEGTDTCSLGEYSRVECELAIGPNANP